MKVKAGIMRLSIFFIRFSCISFLQAYPFNLDWNTIFACPKRPLIVDIGSGMCPWHKSSFHA